MTETVTAEASGATVGEAKWQALRELERLVPSLDRTAVRFDVVTEGEQGLLGVGYVPARVVASVDADAVASGREARPEESETAARVRDLLEHVTAALGIRCRIEIAETDERLTAACDGADVGLLIGRHGATIDAVQVLVAAAVSRGEGDRKEIVVDAAGYRERRRETLEGIAVRAAEDALRRSEPVPLEPMSAAERRIVHERLKGVEGVRTISEGAEPNRRVVVECA